jgi:hypothetical protein
MKPVIWLIAISVTANFLLAGLWLRSARPPAAPTVDSETPLVSSPEAKPHPTGQADETGSFANTKPASILSASTATWKDLQSEDLKEFIRRLRAAGCPEETIQDLILAEVNRRYAARTRALWPERFEQKPFWQVQKRNPDPAEQKKNRENYRQEREWQKEKSALLVELLGVDPEKQRRLEEGLDEPIYWQDRQLAFLPESKREAVQKYLEGFEEKSQEMYARNRGLWDAQSRAEQRALEAEKMAGLAQLLTPSELRDYELRQSQTANQLANDLRNLSVNREQYEAIFDIRKKYGDSIYNYGDLEGKEARQKVEDNQKAMKAELATALGPSLVKEYERSQDYSYQQLVRLAQRNDLPADTAGKVYDYKQAAENSVKQLREDKNLTNEQRQELQQKIRAETEQTLKQTLGEKNYKRYLNDGGWWINNIAPSPPRATAQRPAAVISK